LSDSATKKTEKAAAEKKIEKPAAAVEGTSSKKTEKPILDLGSIKKTEKPILELGSIKKSDKSGTPSIASTDENSANESKSEIETPKTGNKRAATRSTPSNSAKRRKH
jgi:hypothetical protein